MKCIKCGNEINEGDKFCLKCGQPVEEKNQVVDKTYITPNDKKSLNVGLIIFFVILGIALLFVAYIIFSNLLFNVKKTNINYSEEFPELLSSTVNYKGLNFTIPNEYRVEMDSKNSNFIIYDENESWFMSLDVSSGNMSNGKRNLDKLKEIMEDNGLEVEKIAVEKYSNREYIVARVSDYGINYLCCYTQSTPDKIVEATILTESNEYDLEKIRLLSSILDGTTYKDPTNSNNIEFNNKVNLSDEELTEIFN